MNKYLKLWKRIFELELSSEMAYKTNFIIKSFALIIADLIGPIITMLIYSSSSGIPGWSFEEFILFQGTFIFVTGISHAFILAFPRIVVENVREGTFDKILTKPFNTLLYLTFSAIDIEGFAEVFAGIGLIIFAFIKLNLTVFSLNFLIYILIMIIALLFLYSLFIIISALAFLFVRSFALFELLFKILDVSRYPMNIYSIEMRFMFTFILPVAIVSFYPALALLGRFSIATFIEILVPVSIFFAVSLFIWNLGIKKYTSAGG